MKALGQLSPQPYLQDERIKQIFSLLDKSLFVGGCVRDGLLWEKDIYDIDIASESEPQKTMEVLEQAGFNVIATGLKHGTVTVVAPPFNIEITTLREDKETDGRHAKVEFSKSWEIDAQRRDFTINALYADINGVVYDYLNGTAMEDLSKRTIRFIGFADDRIKEDALRILRYFRFYSRFGGTPNRDALSACRRLASEISNLSSERICSEFKKILLSFSPETTLKLMISCEVLQYITKAKINVDYLRQIVWLETHGIRFDSVAPSYLRRLFAMLNGNLDDVVNLAKFLKLSNKEMAFLKTLSKAFVLDDEKQCKYLYGHEISLSCVLLQWAKNRAENPTINSNLSAKWHKKVKNCIDFDVPELPISGEDLIALGLEPSKQFHEILNKAQDLFIKSDYSLEKKELLDSLGL